MLCIGLLIGPPSLHAQGLPPTFRQNPESRQVPLGGVVVFHVEVDGEYSALQWQVDGTPLDGQSGNSLYLNTNPYFTSNSNQGVMVRCVATGLDGSPVASEPALLTPSQGTFGPFPVSSRSCLGCPPPFVGSWDEVGKGMARTFYVGPCDAAECDFTLAFGAADPGSTEEFVFTTTGFLGDTEGRSSGASLKRDGVGLPWWMYGWFDFLTQGGARPTCEVYGDDAGSLTYIGPCDVNHPVGCPNPPVSCRKGYEYYKAQSDMAHSFSWGASQTFTLDGQVFTASRLVFRPSEGQRLLLPAVQKRTVSSITIDNRSTAGTSLVLGKMTGKFSSIKGSSAPAGYARSLGYDLKKGTKRTATFNGSNRFLFGPEVDDPEDGSEIELLHDKNAPAPAPPPLSFSWGVSNTGNSATYRGVDISSGACALMDVGLVVDPPSTGGFVQPECVVGAMAEILTGTGAGGLPHVKRSVNLQCVDTHSLPDFPCELTCDYSELGIANYAFILKKNGQIVGQGSSANTQLKCPRPVVIRICIPTNGEDMGSIYIKLPTSVLRLGATNVVADEVDFMPLGVQTNPVLCITRVTVGGTGAGKVGVSNSYNKCCAVTMGGAAVSVPPGARANEGFFDRAVNFDGSNTANFLLDTEPSVSQLILPTTNGLAIPRRSTGGDRIVPVAINDQPVGFAPNDITLTNSAPSQGRRLVSPTCDLLPGRCDIACDFFDCDGWSLTARGRNLDDSPPAGPTSMSITSHGKISIGGAPPVPGTIGTLHAESADGVSSVVVTPDFTPLGSTTHRLILRLHGVEVFNEPNRSGPAGSCSTWMACAENADTSVCFSMRCSGGGVVDFTPAPGMPPISCDEIRMMAEFPPANDVFVSAKFDCIASFVGWNSVDLDDISLIHRAPAVGSSLPQPSAVVPVGSSTVDFHDPQTGMARPNPRTVNLLNPDPSYPHFPPPAFHVRTAVAGAGTTIDLGGAEAVRFSMRRSDYGTGPDCGVRSTFRAQFAKPDSTATPRVARVTIDRTPTGACALVPNFSQFAAGEIQVYSWPWGTEDCFTGTSSTSRGFAPVNGGYSVTSPVWPDTIATACAPGAVFMGDIIIISFPTPVEMSFAGAPPVVIGAVGFVARPLAPLEPWPIKSCGVICNEAADFVLDDFQVAMMAPAHALLDVGSVGGGPSVLEWSTRHAWLQSSYDGGLTAWSESSAYEIVVKPDGKICHQARIVPPYSPTNPPPPREFLRLVGEWNPYDATIRGR